MITYGFSTIGCPDAGLGAALELCAKHGLDFVELRALGGGAGVLEYFEQNKPPPGMSKVRVLASSFALLGEDEKSRERLCREGKLADEIGAKYIRIFGAGGGGAENNLTNAQIGRAAKTIETLRGEFERRGISCELLLETHDVFSFSGPCCDLNNRLDAPVSILWDSYHTWRHGKEPPGETWARLGPVIRHVHYKDGIAVPGTAGSLYTLPGKGEYPAPELARILKAGKYENGISLEWEKLWHPELPPIEEALDAFAGIFHKI
ncbi:MAG: sugar phosphate isomerase/epimerase [Opitutaceae bacterium]|jgi:sugar phosphate isomerase/epimerase|nr:sugar phosphate isomerase/epimerase [Opitutaceae bacterium]